MKNKSEWFIGICEGCERKHSVRETESGFQCWICVTNVMWKVAHLEATTKSSERL